MHLEVTNYIQIAMSLWNGRPSNPFINKQSLMEHTNLTISFLILGFIYFEGIQRMFEFITEENNNLFQLLLQILNPFHRHLDIFTIGLGFS